MAGISGATQAASQESVARPVNYPGMKMKLAVFIAALMLAALVAGCGDKKTEPATDNGASATETTGATSETGATEPGSAADADFKAPKISGSLKEKPVIEAPSTPPPETLFIKDIKKGTGKKARDGDNVTVQYVGISWSTDVEFDASWKSGKPFDFVLGTGAVIKGWDQGVKGMRVGGRRLLIIPSDLGYGPAGQPPNIGPDETLMFVVDLIKVS